jgi:hypothetical protein
MCDVLVICYKKLYFVDVRLSEDLVLRSLFLRMSELGSFGFNSEGGNPGHRLFYPFTGNLSVLRIYSWVVISYTRKPSYCRLVSSPLFHRCIDYEQHFKINVVCFVSFEFMYIQSTNIAQSLT